MIRISGSENDKLGVDCTHRPQRSQSEVFLRQRTAFFFVLSTSSIPVIPRGTCRSQIAVDDVAGHAVLRYDATTGVHTVQGPDGTEKRLWLLSCDYRVVGRSAEAGETRCRIGAIPPHFTRNHFVHAVSSPVSASSTREPESGRLKFFFCCVNEVFLRSRMCHANQGSNLACCSPGWCHSSPLPLPPPAGPIRVSSFCFFGFSFPQMCRWVGTEGPRPLPRMGKPPRQRGGPCPLCHRVSEVPAVVATEQPDGPTDCCVLARRGVGLHPERLAKSLGPPPSCPWLTAQRCFPPTCLSASGCQEGHLMLRKADV